uniref:Uncharacterized protein n=1 Tax=Glossina palpalis gambiensis TaxID=67801 RepID=A0A1B0BVV7_9MUSC
MKSESRNNSSILLLKKILLQFRPLIREEDEKIQLISILCECQSETSKGNIARDIHNACMRKDLLEQPIVLSKQQPFGSAVTLVALLGDNNKTEEDKGKRLLEVLTQQVVGQFLVSTSTVSNKEDFKKVQWKGVNDACFVSEDTSFSDVRLKDLYIFAKIFPKRAWRWDINTIMDCFLRFLQFDLLTLFCNPFKCEELETKNSSIEMSGKDGKGEIEKTKNAKRPTPKTMDKAAKRRKCQRRTYCNLDTSADSENSFNEDYNDAYDVAESDCEEEDEEIVRNNSYCPNNSGYVRKYNDEGHPAECLPSTSKSSDCIIIENDGHHNGDDPNIGNMFVSKLHRSAADAELLLLSPSDSISETACDRCEEFESDKNNEQEDEKIVRNNSYCANSSGYVRSYNDEGHPAEYRPSTSKSSDCIIIENDSHHNGDDPNIGNMFVSKLHRSTADAEVTLQLVVISFDLATYERLPFNSGRMKRVSSTEFSVLCGANFVYNLDDASEQDPCFLELFVNCLELNRSNSEEENIFLKFQAIQLHILDLLAEMRNALVSLRLIVSQFSKLNEYTGGRNDCWTKLDKQQPFGSAVTLVALLGDNNKTEADKYSLNRSLVQFLVSTSTVSNKEDFKKVQWKGVNDACFVSEDTSFSDVRLKIPFFWAALSDKDISCDPIENFQHFYLTFMPHSSNMSVKKLNEYSRVVWHDMNAKDRLPFLMQAFIAKVASGEANVKDCDELQTFIERVENTTD